MVEMGKIKEAIKQIWNRCNSRIEKQIWRCFGFPDGNPFSQSLSRFEENTAVSNSSSKANLHAQDILKAFFTKEQAQFSAIKDEEVKSAFIKYEKAKERILEENIKKVASFIERIMHFGKRGNRIFWVADITGAALLHPGNPQLRTLNLHAKDFLNAFFRKESKGALCFNNPQFFPTLIIIDAQINAKRKEHERRQAEKTSRFMEWIRANRKAINLSK